MATGIGATFLTNVHALMGQIFGSYLNTGVGTSNDSYVGIPHSSDVLRNGSADKIDSSEYSVHGYRSGTGEIRLARLPVVDLVAMETEDCGYQEWQQGPHDLFRVRREVISSLPIGDCQCEQEKQSPKLSSKSSLEPSHENLDAPGILVRENDCFGSFPTLVGLCLQKIAGRQDEGQMGPFPPGLLSLLRAFRHQKWLQQVQFDWLLKALTQAERSVTDHLICPSKDKRGTCLLFRRDTQHPVSDMSTRNSPDLTNVPDMSALPEPVNGYDASDWCIAVVAHTINMLLPTTVSEIPVDGVAANENDLSAEMASYVQNVRCLLSEWAPTLTQHCFDTALAYVWWSRGYFDRASHLLVRQLTRLISHGEESSSGQFDFNESCLQRGVYLNELGRLMAHADLPDLAVQFYRDAVEFARDEPSQRVDPLKLQSLVLCAAAYDQGVMDKRHADGAREHWDTVLCEPRCPAEITKAALVSLLHCHTGSVNAGENLSEEEMNKQWLTDMEYKLDEISRTHPSAFFYLSVVRALLGKEGALEAYTCFTRYLSQAEGTDVPGIIASSDPNISPWWIFSKWLSDKTLSSLKPDMDPTVSCMPLLWRKVLGEPSCSLGNEAKSSCLSDVCGATLNLRMTDDGFLTGCVTGNLPPMITFLLDPYTGRLCTPDQNRQFELQKWDNLHTKEAGVQPGLRSVVTDAEVLTEVPCSGFLDPSYPCVFRVDTFIPTPIHLLTNKRTGAVLSLLLSNNIVNYKRYASRQDDFEFLVRFPGISHHAAALIYSNGPKDVKVNLRSAILRAKRDAVLRELGNNTNLVSDQDKMKEAEHVLQILIRYNCQMSVSLVQYILDNRQGCFVRNAATATTRENAELLRGTLPPPQTIRVSNILFVGEKTAILSLLCGTVPYSSQNDNALVFVDSETADTFKNPVVHFTATSDASWVLPDQSESWKSPGANKKVFFAFECITLGSHFPSRTCELVVFDEQGTVLMREGSTVEGEGLKDCLRFGTCSGWLILGYNESTAQLVSFNARTRTRKSVHFPRVENIQVAGDVVFVAVPSKVVALNPANLLPLTVTRTHVPLNEPVNESSNNGGTVVEGGSQFLRILATKDSTEGCRKRHDEDACTCRVFLGLSHRVIILQTSYDLAAARCKTMTVTADITIPGIPTELCFISQEAGFVVTAIVSKERHEASETEILYWFDMCGTIRGVHLLLGPGPHGMIAIPLKDRDVEVKGQRSWAASDVSEVQHKRWHLFFADGFGGICCMRIQ